MLKLFVFIFISTFLWRAGACAHPNTSNSYTLELHDTFSEGVINKQLL